MPDSDDITILLNRLTQGSPEVERQLLPLIYRELHRLAGVHLRSECPGHTLQTTALVNEAYLKLAEQRSSFATREHFFALASQMMRRILVDYARQRSRLKRGGGEAPEPLDEFCVLSKEKSAEIIELDEALDRLARLEPRQVRVVELRYFAGLTIEEAAAVLEVSPKSEARLDGGAGLVSSRPFHQMKWTLQAGAWSPRSLARRGIWTQVVGAPFWTGFAVTILPFVKRRRACSPSRRN